MDNTEKQTFEVKKKEYQEPTLTKFDDIIKLTKGGIGNDNSEDQWNDNQS